jgi:hypothetical protein
VTDENGSIAHERCVPKDMIRMAVRVDDVSDRLVGTVRIAASSFCPSRRLPPVSITATPLSPMTNPTLAIAPLFPRVISAVRP